MVVWTPSLLGDASGARFPGINGSFMDVADSRVIAFCPPECPDYLWRMMISECGEESLQALWPHICAISALGDALMKQVGEKQLREFFRHFEAVHGRAARAERNSGLLEKRLQEIEMKAACQYRACQDHILFANTQVSDQTWTVKSLADEREQAQFQLASLAASLEAANRRIVDASAYWERQSRDEKESFTQASVALQQQCLQLRQTLADERSQRTVEAQKGQALAARLDATTDELFLKSRELSATQQRASQARNASDEALARMEQASASMMGCWHQSRDEEIARLNNELQRAALGPTGRGSVDADEVDRSLLLVAALWHAAGRREPPDVPLEVAERRIEESLGAWRKYFRRDPGNCPPFLRPTSRLVLEPLRVSAGDRAAEVLSHQPVPLDAARLTLNPPGPPSSPMPHGSRPIGIGPL